MQNLSSGIIRSYFAKWSFPRISELANLSRVLMPISNIQNSNLYRILSLINLRYRPNKLESISTLYLFDTFNTKSDVSSELYSIHYLSGKKEKFKKKTIRNAGNYSDLSFLQFPITGGSFIEVDKTTISLFSTEVNPGETVINKTISNPSVLYIEPFGYQNNDYYVHIYGNDDSGRIIYEDVKIHSDKIAYETYHKFKTIFKVVTNTSVKISTTVDCSKTHSVESEHTAPKIITDNDGRFIIPKLSISDNSLNIFNAHDEKIDPLFSTSSRLNITHAYLLSSMDILAIDESGWLISQKPKLSLSKFPRINGSFNNNRYITLEDTNLIIGQPLNLEISAFDISSELQSTRLKISLENEDVVYYLNRFGKMTTDSNTWIPVSEMSSSVLLSIPTLNKNPYIFKVITDSGKELMAGAFQYDSQEKYILGNISNMYIYNTELHIEMNDSVFVFFPSRHISMTYSDKESVLDHNYMELTHVD